MPEPGQKKGYWRVKDKNAVTGLRTHQARSGELYSLSASKWTYMPASDAASFLKDEAFEVQNEDEQPVARIAAAPDRHQTGGIVLQPGQVIANLEELNAGALLTRVHQIPGGEGFKANSRKEDLVAFLLQNEGDHAQAARRAAANSEAAAGEVDVEEMDPDEVAEMLPDGEIG